LGVGTDKRIAALPDVPTVAEGGVADFEAWAWNGLAAPAGTPPDVIAKLKAGCQKTLNLPAVKQRFAELSVDPSPTTAEAFGAFISSETSKVAVGNYRSRHFIEVRASKQRRPTFMRLISYGTFGAERAGIEVDGSIVDLEDAMQAAEAEKPVNDIRLFLEQPEWRALTDRCFAARGKVKRIDLASIRLGAPVPVPRTLIIAGANTKSHIAEAGAVLGEAGPPREPMLLAKATSSLCGARDDI